MKMVLVSTCFLDIGQYVEFEMTVLTSPSKSLISSRWVTYVSKKWKKQTWMWLCMNLPMDIPIYPAWTQCPCWTGVSSLNCDQSVFLLAELDFSHHLLTNFWWCNDRIVCSIEDWHRPVLTSHTLCYLFLLVSPENDDELKIWINK